MSPTRFLRLSSLLVFLGLLLLVALFCPAVPVSRGEEQAAAATPQWLWSSKDSFKNELVYFRKSITLEGAVKSAIVQVACDNRATLFVNGEHIFQQVEWKQPSREDVTAKLTEGKNTFAFRCINDEGIAGFLVKITIEMANGKTWTLVSDKSWKLAREPEGNWRLVDYDESEWQPPFVHGAMGIEPWGKIDLSGKGPVATLAGDVVVPPGFQVELLYSVPKSEQGSWVCMTPDPQGRLIVSDQYGGLYRVTPGRTAVATQVEKLDVPIGDAQGVLYAYDSLYVAVNGTAAEGSGFYRVRDTDGDDQFDEVKLLKSFEGAGEHGPHGIRLGPDGMLYVIAGNHTKIPESSDATSPHRNWGEDLLLPRNPDGNGHGTNIMAPGGWIARTDKEGSRWQVVCGGFRNPYDLAFNAEGELFTFDADMEWDTGTPWYRPTRVNHAVSGGEFGWRFGTGKWPAYLPDSVGAVVDIGLGSPTGIGFGMGARFPAKYQRALFISDWTYGKIYAVHMQPRGATYTAAFETFASGRPLPVTDIVINHDGAMYFTTGGRKTQSGLYRVTYTGGEATDPAKPSTDETTAAAVSARETRRKLESFHGRHDSVAVATAWPYLNNPDRALRYAARIAIEHQSLAEWKQRALDESRVTGRINALLALTRAGEPDDLSLQKAIFDRLGALPFHQLTEEQFLDALRVYGLAFVRLGGQTPEGLAAVTKTLNPLYPSKSEFINRELCQLLVYVEAPDVVSKTMKLLAAAQTQEDQMFYVLALRNLTEVWTPDERRAYFSWMNIAETKYRGGSSFKKFVQQIRRDAVAGLTETELAEFREVLEGRKSVEVVKLETTRQFVHNWQIEDLAPLLGQLSAGRSFEKGKQAYEAAQCAKCHRFAGDGGDTGPDITGVGGRFDGVYLLESLVLPSKTISDQYLGVVIETSQGKVVSGRVIEENNERLVVRTDPFARELTIVKKSDIEERTPARVSEMPQGLINVLTKEEVLDLIAYLRSGGNASDKSFQAAGE